jgi:hypothetical protein
VSNDFIRAVSPELLGYVNKVYPVSPCALLDIRAFAVQTSMTIDWSNSVSGIRSQARADVGVPHADRKAFEVIDMDADHVKAVGGNLVFMVWRFRTRAEPYRAGIRLIRKLALSHPEGLGVMQVVEVDAIPPDDETRRAFSDAMQVRSIRHFSVIHEGTGFKAAAVRAIVWGLHMTARPKFAHVVHKSVQEASRWAAAQNEHLGRHDDARGIERTVQQLRLLHRDRYPNPSR